MTSCSLYDDPVFFERYQQMRQRRTGLNENLLRGPGAALRQLGFRALRVVPWLWDLPPSDRRYYPLYAECVELGIPFCRLPLDRGDDLAGYQVPERLYRHLGL
jgi:predicted TIM-barrel fold metal-dependent hydrolase